MTLNIVHVCGRVHTNVLLVNKPNFITFVCIQIATYSAINRINANPISQTQWILISRKTHTKQQHYFSIYIYTLMVFHFFFLSLISFS